MRISVINPNSTASMTARIAKGARLVARPGTEIVAAEPACGPDAIEGPFDGAVSVPELLKSVAAADLAGADAHVVACFDDTGLDAVRALSSRPAIGIGEAAFHAAALVAHSFCVVTTLCRSVPVIEDNIRRYGFDHRCRKVYASDIPVLALDDPASGAFECISGFIADGLGEGAEAVVLGCAGMVAFAAELQRRHGVPVVEGVSAAVGFAETLVACGLSTSKAGLYATPTRKHILGLR